MPGVLSSVDASPAATDTRCQRNSSGVMSGTPPIAGSVTLTSPIRYSVCVIELPKKVSRGAAPKPRPPPEIRVEMVSACAVSRKENTLSAAGSAATSAASNDDW